MRYTRVHVLCEGALYALKYGIYIYYISYLYGKTWLSVYVCLCVCNTNGRSNGLPDLDQNLGMDSHLPWG